MIRRLHFLLGIAAVFTLSAFASHAAEPVEIEVACFKGGYGIDFFEQCAREYEAANPGVRIKLWGNPRVWEQLLPRMATDSPPDLCWPGWGLSVWPMIFEGQLRPLDEYLKQPAFGDTRVWADTFAPGLLDKGKLNGHYYLFPSNIDSFGLWYNKKMFREHGWTPPATYEELLALCAMIKKQGIAPITFTGRYLAYPMVGMYYPLVVSAEGVPGFNDAQNLVPGAWKRPGFLRAARAIMELKRLGYFQGGCIGMNHTESQMEFLVGRAAMIPCGTWLHSEMVNLLPPDFEMGFMRSPRFKDGVGDPTAMRVALNGVGWFIPAKSKHPEIAADFFRFLSSPQKQKIFVEQKGALSPVMGLGELELPPHLEGPLRAIESAKTTWSEDFGQWYPTFVVVIEQAYRDMYNEVITPEQFVEALEAGATKIRDDPNIHKITRD